MYYLVRGNIFHGCYASIEHARAEAKKVRYIFPKHSIEILKLIEIVQEAKG